MLVTIGVFLVFQGVASTFFVVLSLNVFLSQFVGLGSALSMGLDSVDSSLLTEQSDLACKSMIITVS